MRLSSGTKVILLHEDLVLAMQRDDDSRIPYPNKWDFPGGGQEPGETLLDCAYRELYEEFGLRGVPLKILDVIRSTRTLGMQKARAVGRLSTQQVASLRFGSEGQRFGFFSFTELAQLDFVPELRDYALNNQDRILAPATDLNPGYISSASIEIVRV